MVDDDDNDGGDANAHTNMHKFYRPGKESHREAIRMCVCEFWEMQHGHSVKCM